MTGTKGRELKSVSPEFFLVGHIEEDDVDKTITPCWGQWRGCHLRPGHSLQTHPRARGQHLGPRDPCPVTASETLWAGPTGSERQSWDSDPCLSDPGIHHISLLLPLGRRVTGPG